MTFSSAFSIAMGGGGDHSSRFFPKYKVCHEFCPGLFHFHSFHFHFFNHGTPVNLHRLLCRGPCKNKYKYKYCRSFKGAFFVLITWDLPEKLFQASLSIKLPSLISPNPLSQNFEKLPLYQGPPHEGQILEVTKRRFSIYFA